MSAAIATQNGTPQASEWEMEVGSGGQGDYVLCPAGNYPGTLVGLIDIGTHDAVSKDGKPYSARKLIVAFELAKKKPDGKPFVLAERYTWSMRDNSNFFALACGLTGTKYTEGQRFDPRVLIGKACMVQVTNTSKGEKQYHQIASIAQFPEGLPSPSPSMPTVSWSVKSKTAPPDLGWIPFVYGESVSSLIAASHEAKAGEVPLPAKTAPPAAPAGDDDIPF